MMKGRIFNIKWRKNENNIWKIEEVLCIFAAEI